MADIKLLLASFETGFTEKSKPWWLRNCAERETSCKHSLKKYACKNLITQTETGEYAFQDAIGQILFQNKLL